MKLDTVNPDKLKVYQPHNDTLSWLHMYMDYLSSREVKRTYQDNQFPDVDYKRLFKNNNIEDTPFNRMRLYEVDRIAYNLGWIKYERGYVYGSNKDKLEAYGTLINKNVIKINKGYTKYSKILSNDKRYKTLVTMLLSAYKPDSNELFDKLYHGLNKLDKFDSGYSSDYHLLDNINFNTARKKIITCLQQLKIGQWYSTESLIKHLKDNHHYFLIPAKPVFKNTYSKNRYGDFKESGYDNDGEKNRPTYGCGYSSSKKEVSGVNAFARVEGRFIERFLECIPYSLGWVELAYDELLLKQKISPSLGVLKSFKLTPTFKNLYNQTIPEAKITVLPNFEINIESSIAPIALIRDLVTIGDVTENDFITQVKLNKNKVIHKSAKTENFNIVTYLTKLSNAPLPQNVAVDIDQWCQQGESFVLYSNVTLFESQYNHDFIKQHSVVKIDKNTHLIKDEKTLIAQLDAQKNISLIIKHASDKIKPIPKSYRSLLPKEGAKRIIKKQPKLKVTLSKQTQLYYEFSNLECYQAVKQDMINNKIIVSIDDDTRLISFDKKYESVFKQALKSVQNRFQFNLKEEKQP